MLESNVDKKDGRGKIVSSEPPRPEKVSRGNEHRSESEFGES